MNGEDVYSRSDTALAIFRRREVGLIYQFYNLIPVLNVVENITLPVLMDGRKVNDARLQELLDTPGLARLVVPPAESALGGQQCLLNGRALHRRRPSCYGRGRDVATLTARTRRKSWSC